MKRIDTARHTVQSVADGLFETEEAIENAMMKIAVFASDLPRAGQAAGFSRTRGQSVYEIIAEAMVAQSQVRAKIVAVHNALADLKADSVMRTVAIGGGSKCTPPDGGGLPVTGRLELVSRAG